MPEHLLFRFTPMRVTSVSVARIQGAVITAVPTGYGLIETSVQPEADKSETVRRCILASTR